MSSDHVSIALKYALKLNAICSDLAEQCAEAITRAEEKRSQVLTRFRRECGEAVVRRAEDAPHMVYTLGLVPTVTMLMSKAENEIALAVLTKYLIELESVDALLKEVAEVAYEHAKQSNEPHRVEELRRHILRGICLDMCDNGYATMLASLAAYMIENQDILPNFKGAIQSRNYRGAIASLARDLKDIRSKGLELALAQQIMPFLIEFKKLMKAFFEKE